MLETRRTQKEKNENKVIAATRTMTATLTTISAADHFQLRVSSPCYRRWFDDVGMPTQCLHMDTFPYVVGIQMLMFKRQLRYSGWYCFVKNFWIQFGVCSFRSLFVWIMITIYTQIVFNLTCESGNLFIVCQCLRWFTINTKRICRSLDFVKISTQILLSVYLDRKIPVWRWCSTI